VKWENKALLISYFLSNTSAKNYRNRIVDVKIIASRRWDVFETRCISALIILTVRSILPDPLLAKIYDDFGRTPKPG